MTFGSEQVIAADPLTLFQRICIAKQSDTDLKEYFTYELAPYPLSLFNEAGLLRKGTKSLLYRAFQTVEMQASSLKSKMFVLDGGLLLYKVLWDRNDSYGSICQKYVSYVKRHYGSSVIVVFDGYPTDVHQRGTKSSERLRRAKTNTSTDIIFNDTTVPVVAQEKFLGNDRNKTRLIQMLKAKLEEDSVQVLEANEDADVLIVCTALTQLDTVEHVIVVSEDVDMLVILYGVPNASSNVFLYKPERSGKEQSYYSRSSYLYDSQYLLFSHAFTGCDTTSSP